MIVITDLHRSFQSIVIIYKERVQCMFKHNFSFFSLYCTCSLLIILKNCHIPIWGISSFIVPLCVIVCMTYSCHHMARCNLPCIKTRWSLNTLIHGIQNITTSYVFREIYQRSLWIWPAILLCVLGGESMRKARNAETHWCGRTLQQSLRKKI